MWANSVPGIFVAFGGLLFGYDTGTISGIIAMPFWLKGFNRGYTDDAGDPALKSSDKSLIVSILSLGTFIGALSAAPCADFFGRRLGLILSTAIVFSLGVLLQTIATDQPLFIAGRFFAGLGVGLISAQSKLSLSLINHRSMDFFAWSVSTFSYTRSSTTISVGDRTEMDPRHYRRLLPAGNYHRPVYRSNCQQWYQRSQ